MLIAERQKGEELTLQLNKTRFRRIKQALSSVAAALTLLCPMFTSSAPAAQLQITYGTSFRPILVGQPFDVYISMSDLGGDFTAGFQAFLEFDTAEMTFVGGTYMATPFGLPIIAPITAVAGTLDLASGIDTFSSQPPTNADAILVHLQFTAQMELCTPTIQFRAHDPPTRLTDPVGNAIKPIELVPLEPPICPADLDPPGGDGQVNVFDLYYLLSRWNEPPPSTADIAPDGCDGVVDVFDLFFLLQNWGSCP